MKRGPYAKTRAKRDEILEMALNVIAREGYSRTTVRELSEAMGISSTGLMHHFDSKEALLTEVLRRRDALDSVDAEGVSLLAGGRVPLVSGLPEVVRHNADVPGLVHLYTRISAEATEPSHSSHDYFRDRYERAKEAYALAVEQEQEAGRLTRAIDPKTLAVALVALVDGLQTQWMFDPELDMGGVVSSLLAALAVRSDSGGEQA